MLTTAPPQSDQVPSPESSASLARPTARTGRVLRTIIKKELRQHAAHTLLLYLCGGIFWAFVIYTFSVYREYLPSSGNPNDHFNFLCTQVWRVSSLFVFPFTGFFIGAMQAFADRHFGLWSFLTHRPTSRSLQFLGRVMAGVTLYFLSAGIPLLIAFYIASRTGDFFHWRFMLPSLADFLVGIVYYLAGLLTVSRSAAYYGSKFIPCLAAADCSIITIIVPGFSAAMAAVVLFAALFMAAAWGASLSHGYRLRSPIIARVAMNAILLLSCMLLLTGAVILVTPTILRLPELQPPPSPLEIAQTAPQSSQPTSNDDTFAYYDVLHDGTLAKVIEKTDSASQFVPWRYFDLDGREIFPPDLNPDFRFYHRERVNLRAPDPRYAALEPPVHYRAFDEQVREISPTSMSDSYAQSDSVPREKWFYVRSERRYYGYKEWTKQFIGMIGQNGFSPPGQLAQSWPPHWSDQLRDPHITDHALYDVSLADRDVNCYFTTPEDERIIAANRPRDDDNRPPGSFETHEMVSTTRNIDLLIFAPGRRTSANLKQVIKFPNDILNSGDAGLINSASATLFPDTHIMAFKTSIFNPSGPRLLEKVEVYSYPDVKLLSSHQFDSTADMHIEPPTPSPQPLALPASYIYTNASVMGIGDSISGPLMALPLGIFYSRYYPDSADNGDGTAFVPAADQPLRRGIMWSVLALTAAGTFLIGRRYRLRFSILWTLLTFIFGPASMLALIAAHRLPLRTPCPTCHKRRPLDESQCPHCAAAFTSPTRDGIEVFARSTLA